MKICLVTRAEFADIGSISTHVYKLAEYYNKKDHEVYIISTNWNGNNVKSYEEYGGIKVFNYSIIQKPFLLKNMFNVLTSESAILKLNKKYHFDIIHSHEGGQCLTHHISTAHACHKGWLKSSDELFKKNNRYIKYLIYKTLRGLRPINRWALAIERHNYKKGNHKKIIAVSHSIKNQIMDCYKVPSEDIVVIPNGIDCDKFKPSSQKRQRIRGNHRININNKEIIILFSGNDFNKKGLKYLIKAIALTKHNIKVLITGKDNPASYRELASRLGVLDKLIFAGFVPDITEYYAASDVFVSTTLYEPFGLVITEAMASGLPVITSKLAGAAEIIKDGDDALLLDDPTNPDEIAGKINILVEDERLRRQMGKNARKTAEKYSWDEVAKRTLDVYEEISRA